MGPQPSKENQKNLENRARENIITNQDINTKHHKIFGNMMRRVYDGPEQIPEKIKPTRPSEPQKRNNEP